MPILDAKHEGAHPVEKDDLYWSESYYFNGYCAGPTRVFSAVSPFGPTRAVSRAFSASGCPVVGSSASTPKARPTACSTRSSKWAASASRCWSR